MFLCGKRSQLFLCRLSTFFVDRLIDKVKAVVVLICLHRVFVLARLAVGGRGSVGIEPLRLYFLLTLFVVTWVDVPSYDHFLGLRFFLSQLALWANSLSSCLHVGKDPNATRDAMHSQ